MAKKADMGRKGEVSIRHVVRQRANSERMKHVSKVVNDFNLAM